MQRKKKKEKKEKKKKKKISTKVHSILGTINNEQITFITLNNNGFSLLGIYPPWPSTPPAHPLLFIMHQLMDNMKLDTDE